MEVTTLELKPSYIKSAEIQLPGSKSITNRLLLIASLAKGKTKLTNLLFSEDTKIMISALKKLGIKIEDDEFNLTCTILGSENKFPSPKAKLYIANAGTVIRPLTACLAFNDGDYMLHGTSRMHERPIKDLVNSLRSIGANIDYTHNSGYPPLHIKKIDTNKDVKYNIKVRGDVSSQYLTSILIASTILSKKNPLIIEVIGELISKPYVEITLKLLQKFNLKIINQENNYFTIPSNQTFKSCKNFIVEGDASSASYFLAAGAISGQEITVKGVGNKSVQGDIQFTKILKKMGANITLGDDWIKVSSNKQLNGIDVDLNHIPDAAMTVAILALYSNGTSRLRNIESWRVKETDRISAMAKELKKVGAIIEEGIDFLQIEPPKSFTSAKIETYSDHRIAMCFSLLSINSPYKKGAKITIINPNCVSKTFPNYFEVFNKILK